MNPAADLKVLRNQYRNILTHFVNELGGNAADLKDFVKESLAALPSARRDEAAAMIKVINWHTPFVGKPAINAEVRRAQFCLSVAAEMVGIREDAQWNDEIAEEQRAERINGFR